MLARLCALFACLLTLILTPLVSIAARDSSADVNPTPAAIYQSAYPVITPDNVDSLTPIITLSRGSSRHDKALKRPVWSPDSQTLAVVGGGSQEDPSHMGIWMYAIATPDNLLRLLEHDAAYSVTFSPDGRWLASISDTSYAGGKVVVWDVASGEQHLTLENVPILAMHFTSDSTKLVTTYWDTLSVWEIETKQEIFSLESICNPVLSPDEALIATTDCEWSGVITLIDRGTGRQFVVGEQNSLIIELAFSPAGDLLAAWDNDRNIGLWGLTGNIPDRIISSGDYDIAYPTNARFSPDGTILASWNERGDTIHLWSVATSEHMAALGGHHVTGSAAPGGSTLDIAFSPAAALLASFWGDYDDTEDKNLRLWDAATGNLLLTLPNEFSASFSPDGTMLATDSYDGTIKIWAVDDSS